MIKALCKVTEHI